MIERIELRSDSGTLLGILVGGTAIEIKRGQRLFEVDLLETLGHGRPVILERVLFPDDPVDTAPHLEMEGIYPPAA